MQTGIEVLPPFLRNVSCAGTILAFVTENLEDEEKRLRSEGVTISMPLQTEEWGEKLFMVTDPNGVVIELVEWINQEQERGNKLCFVNWFKACPPYLAKMRTCSQSWSEHFIFRLFVFTLH